MLAQRKPRDEESLDPLEETHRPALLREVIELLRPGGGAILVDATVGAGGHTQEILDRVGPAGRVYGIDRDPEALAFARERLDRFGDRFVPIQGNHEDIADLLAARGVVAVDGVLADLGLSSRQLDDPERGFSFLLDGPLDMRMGPDSGSPA